MACKNGCCLEMPEITNLLVHVYGHAFKYQFLTVDNTADVCWVSFSLSHLHFTYANEILDMPELSIPRQKLIQEQNSRSSARKDAQTSIP